MTTQFDMFGIGNAMLDIEYNVSDEFLIRHGVEKRRMTLVDQSRLLTLVAALDSAPTSTTCGGSVANTLFAMRGFGCSGYLACRVAPDREGEHFVDHLKRHGIGTNPIRQANGHVTGRCLVLVTGDAERSMSTCLGISDYLDPEQVDEEALQRSSSIYVEGYLASSPTGTQAAVRAMDIANEFGLETNLTISDTSIVNAFRPALERMVANGLSRVFANAEEAFSWCRTDSLSVALNELQDIAREVVITLGPNGCAIQSGSTRFEERAYKVDPIDLNGAGDMFAAGYLAHLKQKPREGLRSAARFANFAAASVIQITGARFENIARHGEIEAAFNAKGRKEFVG